ncbi:MAG: hypothetical protein L0331_26530, partial [Chloroflexi bacterium]|nr:hypothetical protein [Chloroflexota bacterium]
MSTELDDNEFYQLPEEEPDSRPPAEEIQRAEERRTKRRVRLIACGLLIVLLCGVASAPLAVLYWWTTNRDGQEAPAAATAGPESELAVTESSDGVNRIAYITLDQQLATVAPDGSEQHLLTNQEEQRFQFPAWSPDSALLAVVGGG